MKIRLSVQITDMEISFTKRKPPFQNFRFRALGHLPLPLLKCGNFKECPWISYPCQLPTNKKVKIAYLADITDSIKRRPSNHKQVSFKWVAASYKPHKTPNIMKTNSMVSVHRYTKHGISEEKNLYRLIGLEFNKVSQAQRQSQDRTRSLPDKLEIK